MRKGVKRGERADWSNDGTGKGKGSSAVTKFRSKLGSKLHRSPLGIQRLVRFNAFIIIRYRAFLAFPCSRFFAGFPRSRFSFPRILLRGVGPRESIIAAFDSRASARFVLSAQLGRRERERERERERRLWNSQTARTDGECDFKDAA
jgi:hypothetical protein